VVGRQVSVTLAKQTETVPTKASPRPLSMASRADLRPEKGQFTRMGVKFIPVDSGFMEMKSKFI